MNSIFLKLAQPIYYTPMKVLRALLDFDKTLGDPPYKDITTNEQIHA